MKKYLTGLLSLCLLLTSVPANVFAEEVNENLSTENSETNLNDGNAMENTADKTVSENVKPETNESPLYTITYNDIKTDGSKETLTLEVPEKTTFDQAFAEKNFIR